MEALNTFEYIQYHVYDGTEHVLDVAKYSTHCVICDVEYISSYYHRVHEANVDGSWETQTGNEYGQKVRKANSLNCVR